MSESDVGPVDGHLPAPLFTDGTIVFHCPRGHRLVVAAKYAGKRGRCDKKGCGAPVTIPVPPAVVPAAGAPEVDLEPVEPPAVEALPPEPVGDPEPVAPAPEPGVAERAEAGGWDFISDAAVAQPSALGSSADTAFGDVRAAPDQDAGIGNPTARLVARLWEERDHGGIVELHLVGGSVILPEWYEATWSRGTHGLFASQAPDGTVTLTAVAWEAIQKVVVRQVRDLPDGMFE